MGIHTRIGLAVVAGGALWLAGGCVSQQAYDDSTNSARSLAARNQELLEENEQLLAMVSAKDQRIRDLQGEKGQLEGRIGDLDSNLGRVRTSMTDLDEQLRGLRFSGIDPATDRALRKLAASNPALIQYDATRGMVRLGSDLTFDSGSDVVKPAARASLQQLAGILLASEARGYDLRVVGHTDSQRPSSSKAKHPTNRHLSAHRSIAVGRVLESSGVPGYRIEIAGWGEYRPVVANSATGGTKANRRVELYLIPTSMEDTRIAPANEPASAAESGSEPTARRLAPMK